MCSAYVINGTRCETGFDLIAAIGVEAARRVNPPFGEVDGWDECCLCHVNREELESLVGCQFELDPFDFVPVASPSLPSES